MAVVNRANLTEEELGVITREVARHDTLDQVVRWGLAQPAGTVIPQVIAQVVVQDEYSHDVVVPWRDGLVLVYGTT